MVPLFAGTLFLSAALLFLVQPMVGRMILPVLGGTPAVWNTCMVFFQAVLLAGYAYAHAGVSLLGVRRHAALHVLVLTLPLWVLPIRVVQGVAPPNSENPAPWLLWQLLLSVGAPFFVVATTGPLLQRWFAQTGHRDARDPYFLYAVSNLGSFLALLAYPAVVEPRLWLSDQSRLWAAGYLILIVLIAMCAIVLLRSRFGDAVATSKPDRVHDEHSTLRSPTFALRAWWVLLSFVPSSLMLGVTSYITTDLATIPLLWILPLALYLLTIVMAFARSTRVSLKTLSLSFPGILPFWLIAMLQAPIWIVIVCHLLVFFLAAWMCHSRLAASRPAPVHLTEFYLWMGIGGLLGGLFNAFLAPIVFDRVMEYQWILVLACMLKPPLDEFAQAPRITRADITAPALLLLAAWGAVIGLEALHVGSVYPPRFVVFFAMPVACFFFRNRPIRFGLSVAAFLALSSFFLDRDAGSLKHRERNFFGAKEIRLTPDGAFLTLIHGGITHGLQSTDPRLSREPFAYYHRTSPVADVLAAFQRGGAPRRAALIGLGTGALAAYAEPGDRFTFYEIDPAIARLSGPGGYFTYLSQCRGRYDIVLGDGRLTLNRATDSYGLIVVDAFSSDSIPVHLLCREAVQLYLSKLAEHGVLVFHVSSLYLDLVPVVGDLALDAGLSSLVRTQHLQEENRKAGRFPTCYVALARRESDLAALSTQDWKTTPTSRNRNVWTDQYCNVLGAMRWK